MTTTNTPPKRRRASRESTTGTECRFPETAESLQHLAAIIADLERRGEPATVAAACRYALKETAKGIRR